MAGAVAVFFVLLAAASGARAEALPGRFEVAAGGNLFALFAEHCTDGGDVVSCSGLWPFAGFELGFRTQANEWMSVGMRVAGGKDLDAATAVSGDGAEIDRDLWLVRGSAEFRFDPPIWPRGLWLAGELGGAMFVDATELVPFDDRFASTSASSRGFGVLFGVAVGWDFPLARGFVLGTEVRAQYISAPTLDVPELADGRVRLDAFPYISLALRGAYRW